MGRISNAQQVMEYEREVELLAREGIIEKVSIEESFYHKMQFAGLTAEEVLGVIGNIMNNAQRESEKLAAARVALQLYMHPAFVPRKELEGKVAPVINFNISGGNVDLKQILTPLRVGEGS